NRNVVIERGPDGDLLVLHPFGNLGEPRSPQNGEASQDKKKVVEQKTGFARDQRFQLMFTAQMRFVLHEKEHETGEAERQEPGKPVSDRGLGKGVDGADNSAAGKERAQDRQPEGGKD